MGYYASDSTTGTLRTDIMLFGQGAEPDVEKVSMEEVHLLERLLRKTQQKFQKDFGNKLFDFEVFPRGKTTDKQPTPRIELKWDFEAVDRICTEIVSVFSGGMVKSEIGVDYGKLERAAEFFLHRTCNTAIFEIGRGEVPKELQLTPVSNHELETLRPKLKDKVIGHDDAIKRAAELIRDGYSITK